jgi:hypothetical protein
MFDPGTYIRKRNFASLAGGPCLRVDTATDHGDGTVTVNGKWRLSKSNVVELDHDQAEFLFGIWEDCSGLSVQVPVEGRVPCSRSDGESKRPVPEQDVQAKLFQIRMSRNDMSFQAYRCPDCGSVHIGRNPYVDKDIVRP